MLINFLVTATPELVHFCRAAYRDRCFASTNVDDLFLLASLFVDADSGRSQSLPVNFLACRSWSHPAFWQRFLPFRFRAFGFTGLVWRLCSLASVGSGIYSKGALRPDSSDRNGSDFVGKEQLRSGWRRSETALWRC